VGGKRSKSPRRAQLCCDKILGHASCHGPILSLLRLFASVSKNKHVPWLRCRNHRREILLVEVDDEDRSESEVEGEDRGAGERTQALLWCTGPADVIIVGRQAWEIPRASRSWPELSDGRDVAGHEVPRHTALERIGRGENRQIKRCVDKRIDVGANRPPWSNTTPDNGQWKNSTRKEKKEKGQALLRRSLARGVPLVFTNTPAK